MKQEHIPCVWVVRGNQVTNTVDNEFLVVDSKDLPQSEPPFVYLYHVNGKRVEYNEAVKELQPTESTEEPQNEQN